MKEGKRERGKEGRRGRGTEGKRERGIEGKRKRGKEGKRGRGTEGKGNRERPTCKSDDPPPPGQSNGHHNDNKDVRECLQHFLLAVLVFPLHWSEVGASSEMQCAINQGPNA